MSNRKGNYKKISQRVELRDIMATRKFIKPLTKDEKESLSDYISQKTLLVYDTDLDYFKEEK